MKLLAMIALTQAGSAGWIAGLIAAAVILLREVFIRIFSSTRRR